MRHQKSGKKLGRTRDPRKALLRSLATSFVLNNGKIKTTKTKAQAVRPIIEKYITASKKNELAVKRNLEKYFYTGKAVKKLLEEIGPKYKDRKGGYTRIIKIGPRSGDQAQMVSLELV
ncbi:50S ribosomal protein L17 [Candidatus Falkowbacteria bacterium RIFOXYD2_FULL_35_9]|uniref:Large ribosomal subunit protein bL17 n=1 Tax=Candidatus Falkowbacteria bacterium RIFOXYC2_FULL_36_12 TaxID=1798002 RepID=A0A1F5SYC5_9BACT|nr:MAG: 50S ribosomal protein L17 [Candidatus Falkowbacteria bacterium RIFOXYB2_FULL_35_7]OGF31714.1 MAG: 50S ribosomal protein L17 [Candidatus Falkowbacteria bacterium RIFOXYC2_FULL_36_12]OGF33161.1 MAG: 50S ribosomal protein L17 [Candidatus Falkowbacteria bacterium RIFOXYA2_FULL_35_8]OGF46193.1 MAG: 50S ribosomal protein L17 [Candidatus Falkowbacteria bacterium RIFOXYD2_FULL_35_9]